MAAAMGAVIMEPSTRGLSKNLNGVTGELTGGGGGEGVRSVIRVVVISWLLPLFASRGAAAVSLIRNKLDFCTPNRGN